MTDPKMTFLLLAILVASLPCMPVSASSAPGAPQANGSGTEQPADVVIYDENRDGLLSPEEFATFYGQSKSRPLVEFDVDADGRLSKAEIRVIEVELAKLAGQAREQASDYAARAQRDNAEGEGLEAEEVANSPLPLWGLMVRESHGEVNLRDPEVNLRRVRGASVAMTQDIGSDSRIVSVKGAILRPTRLGADSNHLLLPGIELNRLTNDTEPEREVDSLTFRLGSAFRFERQWLGGSALYVHVNPLVTTNFGFDVDVRAIEIQMEPSLGDEGLGADWGIGPLGMRLRMLFQAEYGEVVDAGNRDYLREGDSFSRLGAKFGLKLVPKGIELIEGLEGSINYEHFEDLSGDLRARSLLSAALQYKLDEDGRLTLETKYFRGDSSVALENEETWTVGLGVKL